MTTDFDYEPDFTPVQLARKRHDGWTPERQRQFLIMLCATGTVDAAATAVGMSRISAYNLRNRAGADSFAREWDKALGFGKDMMLDYALERALEGVTTIRMKLGGVIDVEHGPDRRQMMRAIRIPPPPRKRRSEGSHCP